MRMPEGMKAMMEREMLHGKYSQLSEDLGRKTSETAETRYLMSLWADLGDHTETYWAAMKAVSRFVEIKRTLAKRIDGFAPPVKRRLLQAVIEMCAHQLEICDEVEKMAHDFEKEMEAINNKEGA